MADNARLISGYSKIGTSPDAGTTWSLTHLLGRRRALEVMLLNDPIDARAAHALGLVNKVVQASELESETLAFARRLADGPPATTGRIKSLVDQACVSDLEAQLDQEKAAFIAAASTSEFSEGIKAFFERRPPEFQLDLQAAVSAVRPPR
jgi:2-(1,2-epoxy-1,2-dihydrophenyl)acetyl-CoA isomerase